MSELVSYNSERIYWAVEQVEREAGDIDFLHLDDNLFYLKSDVDPVIAELNARVDFLKTAHDSCGSCNKCADGMGEVFNKELNKWKKELIEQTTLRVWAEMQLRHNKYERCLANAKYWIAVSYQCVDDKHRQIANKRHYKWLKLSENFKEANNGTH